MSIRRQAKSWFLLIQLNMLFLLLKVVVVTISIYLAVRFKFVYCFLNLGHFSPPPTHTPLENNWMLKQTHFMGAANVYELTTRRLRFNWLSLDLIYEFCPDTCVAFISSTSSCSSFMHKCYGRWELTIYFVTLIAKSWIPRQYRQIGIIVSVTWNEGILCFSGIGLITLTTCIM